MTFGESCVLVEMNLEPATEAAVQIMKHDTIRDYLIRSDMKEGQAEALARIFSEMATKSDLNSLEQRMRSELANMRAELTWKMIAIVGFFATASTLLNLFAG